MLSEIYLTMNTYNKQLKFNTNNYLPIQFINLPLGLLDIIFEYCNIYKKQYDLVILDIVNEVPYYNGIFLSTSYLDRLNWRNCNSHHYIWKSESYYVSRTVKCFYIKNTLQKLKKLKKQLA